MKREELYQLITSKIPLKQIIYTLALLLMILFIWYWYHLEYVPVKVYFSTRDAKYLVPVERQVPLTDKYYQVVQELIRGPGEDGLTRTLPEGTRLLDITVKGGIAYLNMSRELRDRHWGGSTGEILTVYSLVNSLAQFPEVKRVQLLLEGEKVTSLVGHLELNKPLKPDYSLVRELNEQSSKKDLQVR